MKNKLLLCIPFLCFIQFSHACELKDYECIKQERNGDYYTNNETTYVTNEKIFVNSAYDDEAAISLNSNNSNYNLRNVRIVAKNFESRNQYGGTSILEANNYSSDPDAIRMEDVSLDTIGTNELSGTDDYLDDGENLCVASYCQYGQVESYDFINTNTGSLTLNID